MCGIAIIFRKPDGRTSHHEIEHKLHEMLLSFSHRGPDGTGFYYDDNQTIGMAMCRLAIVDQSNGQQPIYSEDQSVVIICNGEIYNHRELRRELENAGHVFYTDSDVEVIVHLYEEIGFECIHRLEGIYAFALWDRLHQRLFVARDRLGVKPLYFKETIGSITFASELRALLVRSGEQEKLNLHAFYAYNLLRYVPAPNTLVNGIHKIGAGQCGLVTSNGREIWTYWTPPTETSSISKQSLPRENATVLRELMFDAVSSQLATGVKSGVLLSGGLDSSLILSICSQVTSRVPDSYTVSFSKPTQDVAETEYSELQYAQDIARYFGSKHHSECCTAQDVLEQLPAIISAIDEPIADPTAVPLWFATQLAGQSGVKVLFSGEGLDEIFNGYSFDHQIRWTRALKYLPVSMREFVSEILRRLQLPGGGILGRSINPIWTWYQSIGAIFSSEEVKGIIESKSN